MRSKNLKYDVPHALLDVILDVAVDAIITINNRGEINTFSRAAEKLFGYSEGEVIGKNIKMLMPEPYRSEHDSYLENHEATGVKKIIGFGREVKAKHKNGKIFPICLSVGEAKFDGELMYIGILHDISKRKKQENELEKHRDHLQLLVEERTQELMIANKKLKELVNIDSLTCLPNRRAFDETLQKEILRAIRHKHTLSLIMCDIDYFKKFNDTYGHLAGDKCLVNVAECLRTSFKRASDLPARYGGEEFAIILPQTEGTKALSQGENFIKNLKKLKIAHSKSDISDYVTVSLGLVTIIPDKTSNANSIIKAADEALYNAKGHGRNRIEVSNLE